MRFLADENIRSDVVKYLIGIKHDVKVAQVGDSDKVVALLAKREKRILLTHDSDFSRTLQYPPKNYEGISIIRIHPPRFEPIVKNLTDFLKDRTAQDVIGKTFVLGVGVCWELE